MLFFIPISDRSWQRTLRNSKNSHDIVITLEDGQVSGRLGEKIARYYGNSNINVLNYMAKKEFPDRVALDGLYSKYHLTKELITTDIKTLI